MAATTTLAQVRSIIRDRLDDQTFDGGIIDRNVNNYIFAITGAHDFVFLEASATPPTITVGNNTIALPLDYQHMNSLRMTAPSNYVTDLKDYYMNRNDFDRLTPSPTANPAGAPQYWKEYAQTIVFNQPADQTYTYALDYQKAPALLVNDSDVVCIPNEFIECVVSGAVYRIQNRDDDYDLGMDEDSTLTPLEISLIKRYGSGRNAGKGSRMGGGLYTRNYRKL